MSTGSPLLPEQFGWIYDNVRADVQLASISGGTDIVSCFVLGNPSLPVRAGEIQCMGLGMDVQVWDSVGKEVIDQPGELVCTNAFPSMPVGFWNDPDRSKFRGAYFSRFDGVWWHGDWTKKTRHGGFVIYGRSDATLNPGGVRIGTGEIYQQIATFPQIAESVATALRRDGDERIVLFVKMLPGFELTDELTSQLKMRLRTHCSPRHVPAYIVSAPDLPKTLSGKLSEIAVRNSLIGTDIGNVGALANPDCLAFFSEWAQQV
jgi:acetoacetyl-CoA synthetase